MKTARKLGQTILATTLLMGGSAFAADGDIAAVEIHDGDNAGRLWPNNTPQNNNQRGAGAEHSSCAMLKKYNTLVCFATASYTDISNAAQVNLTNTRIQGLCASYEVSPTAGLVPKAKKYITNNNSPDYQNAHKTTATAVLGGSAALLVYGYDPNGNNTKGYAQAIGPNCENLSGTEFAQTEIIAKNNDNLGGGKVAGVFDDTETSTRVLHTFIGNGNGADDGWLNHITVTTDGTKVTVKKDWDLSIVTNEERSRAECQALPNNRVACAWAEGNAQPPNRGLRMGLIDVAPGTPAANRIVWKKYIKEKVNNLYYSTPSLMNVADPDNTTGSKMMLSFVEVDTTNRQGRTKGRTTEYTVSMDITETGPTLLDTPRSGLLGIGDGAHPGLCELTYGKDRRPAIAGLHPTLTDGGTATMTIMGLDSAGKIEGIKAVDLGMSVAGGYISLFYGQNPNTPQGRNYHPDCLTINNPGYGMAGGYKPLVEKFLVMPISGTKRRPDNQVQDKLAWDILLFPSVVHDAQDPVDPNPTPAEPTPDDDGPGGSVDNGAVGGCNTGAGGSAGLALLLGLGLMRRRRR